VLKFFSSSYTHKVEPKGRVSIPSDYRKILEAMGSGHVVVLPQLKIPEAHVVLSQAGYERVIERFETDAKQMQPQERDALQIRLIARASPLSLDEAGRIVLPEALRQSIGVTNEVAFVGNGSSFELWHPGNRSDYEGSFGELDAALAAKIDLGGLH